ncbi:MAG: glycosyltransferase family protein [Burkholderiales bacterium]
MTCIAILVNYRTSAHTLGAAYSLADQEGCEVHVIDNSMDEAEARTLRMSLPEGAMLHVADRNLGFARACNRIYRQTESATVLLLNPDARLLPGALAQMHKTLFSAPDVGAVGPLTYWDKNGQFMLPPSTFPSLANLVSTAVSRLHPALARRRSSRFRKKALALWTSKKPVRVDALSGGHVLLRRSAIEECGGLFDERFFMYWEDSDLMERLRLGGYMRLIDPAAKCQHFYEHHPAKDALIAQGWPLYAEKHFAGKYRARAAAWLEKYAKHAFSADSTRMLTENDEPLRFPVPADLAGGWLLETSPSPDFIPAIGRIGHGPVAIIPPECWTLFRGRDYYCRLTANKPHTPCALYWHWQGQA